MIQCSKTSNLVFYFSWLGYFLSTLMWLSYSFIKKKNVSLRKTPLPYIALRHTLPLFHPTPCMPSPYSIPPHAHPAPIPSHPMHTLLLFHPTPCTPSPYSIPPHACPPPILSQPMHALPLFYPSPCMPSTNSIPAHAIPVFHSIIFQPMHALLTPCHIHLEGMFLIIVWHLHLQLLNQLTLSISSSSSTLLSNFEYHFITLWHLNVCCFHSHELTTWATHYIHC